jgi:hypothetical protein
MFIVLAIGCLMDTNQAPFNLEAEKYYHLSRAALFQHALMDDPTLHAVQALVRYPSVANSNQSDASLVPDVVLSLPV